MGADRGKLACPREDCADFGEVNRGNVRMYRRYGAGRWALLRCTSCRRTFSERRWTPLFRFQLPGQKVLEILRLLSKGASIRRVATDADVDKNTVLKVLTVVSRRLRWFQVALVQDFGTDPAEADAIFGYLREKTRHRSRKRALQAIVPRTMPAAAARSAARPSGDASKTTVRGGAKKAT